MHGVLVQCLSAGVGQKVRQVGTDDDQGLRPAPEPLQHLCHFGWRRIADGQRQQFEIIQHRLQKRQLDFQRVFLRVGRRADDDLRHPGQRGHCRQIDLDFAQRGGKGGSPR